MKNKSLLTGAFCLMAAGIASRVIGFFYRIFLSRTIGAVGIGIYQLVFPVYGLCLSLCASGIQHTISRCMAASLAKREERLASRYFTDGFLLSFALSSVLSALLFFFADPVCGFFLHETDCAPLLRILSPAIPLGVIHTCANAWYFARRRSGIPALGQLVEQIVRVASSLLVNGYLVGRGISSPTALAALGVLAGKMAAAIFSVFFLVRDMDREEAGGAEWPPFSCISEIVALAAPLTANHLLLALLKNAEAVLIPALLVRSGLDRAQAVAALGSFTGMALPCILFPNAVTAAVCAMLIPSIASRQARGDVAYIRRMILTCIRYGLLFGILTGGLFHTFGRSLGQILFQDEAAGLYIQILSLLCPFLYLTSILTAILNGLGKTRAIFVQQAIGLAVRIACIIAFMPRFGMAACLWGVMAGQCVAGALNLYFLRKNVAFSLSAGRLFFLPAASQALGCAAGRQLALWIQPLAGELIAIAAGGLLAAALSILLWAGMGLLDPRDQTCAKTARDGG